MTAPNVLPDYIEPAKLAAHFGVSERTVRELVRATGAFAKIGRKIVIFPEHVEQIKEAMKCPSKSISAAKSGTTGVQLPEGDYEALRAQRRKKSRNVSRRKQKETHGEVISMDRGRM